MTGLENYSPQGITADVEVGIRIECAGRCVPPLVWAALQTVERVYGGHFPEGGTVIRMTNPKWYADDRYVWEVDLEWRDAPLTEEEFGEEAVDCATLKFHWNTDGNRPRYVGWKWDVGNGFRERIYERICRECGERPGDFSGLYIYCKEVRLNAERLTEMTNETVTK